MDTGAGGVIAALEEDMQIEVERKDAPTYRSQTWPYPCIAVWVSSRCSISTAQGTYLDAAMARQLAAALVALADEIEIGDALSRAEIAEMLRGEGYRTTERQIRYWVRLGHIPPPVVRKRTSEAPGYGGQKALYRRDQIPAIRSVAEWYCRKEQP